MDDGLVLLDERGTRVIVEALHRLCVRHVRPRNLDIRDHQRVWYTAVCLQGKQGGVRVTVASALGTAIARLKQFSNVVATAVLNCH